MTVWWSHLLDIFDLAYLQSSCWGYTAEQFLANMKYAEGNLMSSGCTTVVSEVRTQLTVAKLCRMMVLHKDPNPRVHPPQTPPIELASMECSGLSIGLVSDQEKGEWRMKGTLRSLQLMDLTFPREMPKEMKGMPNRYFISAAPPGVDGAIDATLRSTVDFIIDTSSSERTSVRVRLESVNAAYLHRVYKQFQHYVGDHVMAVFETEIRPKPSTLRARSIMSSFNVSFAEFAVPLEDAMYTFFNTFYPQRSPQNSPAASKPHTTEIEIVANDLVFSLPRNSFSDESIILRCTNARFWSTNVDAEQSDFLTSGLLDEDNRMSHPVLTEATATKLLQTKRAELRNLRRLIKYQRSRMLSNRSQLYVDLKNARQQAQNYLHEGFESYPVAEEAVKIIQNKILGLEKQLDQIGKYLKEVDDAIETAKIEADAVVASGRESLHVAMPLPIVKSSKNGPEMSAEIIQRIRAEVQGMTQSLMAPIFGADDAEFHDARVAATERSSMVADDLSTSAASLFEFELVDISGSTTNSLSPLFHHALLTGRIDSLPETASDGTLSSYLSVDLSLNELSVGARSEQYRTLLGIIFENFKEIGSAVDEDVYPLCSNCGGHHLDSYSCRSIWLKIPVKVTDAVLRIANDEHSIADFLFEQLELVFTMRTDDSLELNASAASLSAIDVRPSRCDAAMEILRPLTGDGLQIRYNQLADWTDSHYELFLNNTYCLMVHPVMLDCMEFFVDPVVDIDEFLAYDVGFMCSAPPDWNRMEFALLSQGCSFALLEDFRADDSRALVMESSIELAYSTSQKCEDTMDMTKCHFSLDQHGVYFSQLPDLQIDVSFPLANPFLLVFDHLVEGSVRLFRRNSFVLAPVEARFSVQDGLLFVNIVNNYMTSISSSRRQREKVQAQLEAQAVDDLTVDMSARGESTRKSSISGALPLVFASDRLLGNVGELRFVLVNNSLGIPIADFQLSEIVCEYIQDHEYSIEGGAKLSLNYFNNSIYRWEPLVEPFKVEISAQRGLEENTKMDLAIIVRSTINFNLTPAMAPLLSSDALKHADFVTTGSKSTAPFWIVNKTGSDIKFSFRRGSGNVIQQIVPDNVKVAVDCREQGDMRSFDSSSTDRFLLPADRQTLTVNHTISVWLNDSRWVSINPVIVDVVGHISVPLRETSVEDQDELFEEEASPPVLVAEISIQPDGSKLISLHSQVVLQNRTSVPLMVWAFSPRDGGLVKEWVVDREQICHIPLHLIHPHSKISVRPSPSVQYAPLATSLEELGDEARATKASNAKRFIRTGICACSFESFMTEDDVKREKERIAELTTTSTGLLSGYVMRDLPTWKCTYDVEAYFLMRAAFSSTEETKSGVLTEQLAPVAEDASGVTVEEEFLNVFSGHQQERRHHHPSNEANHDFDEVRNPNQRRGLYEATNSSLYHLSVSPFMTLHNRLAAPVAYRLLNRSLQLLAEGILAIGCVLPIFQIDPADLLFVSFRLENYNWSVPKLIVNPKVSAYTLPFKDIVQSMELMGRSFEARGYDEQGNVPNLQLQVKLSGRDVIVFCSVWIVNHTGLDLEYCNSTSSSTRRLESMPKYAHRSILSDAELQSVFSTRSLSFRDESDREVSLTKLSMIKPAANPVAVIVVVQEASELYNAQYFGSQSPYVRASLFVVKNLADRSAEKAEMQVFCSATTKPSPYGGVNPTWDSKLQNTLLLRLPEERAYLERAFLSLEVRNVRYGMDTCLGVTSVRLDKVLHNRDQFAEFRPYKLVKRKSSKERKKQGAGSAQATVHRGYLTVSFAVGTKQELQSDFDVMLPDTPESVRSRSSSRDANRASQWSNGDEAEVTQSDDDMSLASLSSDFLPTSSAIRSMHRLQTPSSAALPYPEGMKPPISIRTRQPFANNETESTRSHDSAGFEALSTRSAMGRPGGMINASPPKSVASSGNLYPICVYLPHNRFACVVVDVAASFLMSDIFDLVCSACGFQDVLEAADFDFYELLLPRFISLRSAGRPEGERWYGVRIPMSNRLEKRGRQYGLHLCHKLSMSTIRLYDETSTASSHHATPRSLLTKSQRVNPAQRRAVAWGEVLLYGSGGKNWDVLRIRSHASPWSDVIRLNRNAMGNAGMAQVITLTAEATSQDESSELRKGNHEIALWSTFGSGRFSETIVATIVPRYILINRTNDTIKYRQVKAPQTLQLSPNELVSFHWPSAAKEKLLEVTLLHGYGWSSSFRIHSLGTTYLKLRSSDDPSKIYILQCQIEMIGGSVALIFREESKRFPPYRIDNMTSFRIQYKQSGWGSEDGFDELPPRSSCAYSWDLLTGNEKQSQSSSQDPTFPTTSSSSSRMLQVRFMRVTSSTGVDEADKAAVETREYQLDEMTSHRRIQLQRSLPSELFTNPDHKGYLLKKDNLLKWNKRFFRLYDHMLYYFAGEQDQELLGVVDLRAGASVPGAGGVAIFEKPVESSASKGGFISLNGLVSTIFGSSAAKQTDQDSASDDDDDEQARTLVQLAVAMSASSLLCEHSEKYVTELRDSGGAATSEVQRNGFYVNGHDLVDFLLLGRHVSNEREAHATAEEMLQLKIILPVTHRNSSASRKTTSRFQYSHHVWYSVNSINLAEDSDSVESSEEGTPNSQLSTPTPVRTPSRAGSTMKHRAVPRSMQFSIVTTTKCFELKAKTAKEASVWVKRLRRAARQPTVDDEERDELSNGSRTRSQQNIGPTGQAAKTYVHVRVRADGPTKVLELFEGGEEESDERDLKHEMSSLMSVSSGSPTSETSTNAFDSFVNGVAVHLQISGIGVSCVNEIPVELVYGYLGGVNIQYSRINSKMRLKVTLDDIQVDNQSSEATFCKLLCPRMEGDPDDTDKLAGDEDSECSSPAAHIEESVVDTNGHGSALVASHNLFRCADCKYVQKTIASMHFCCTWSNEQGTTDYFEHFSFWLYPVIMQLDEETLVAARAFLNAVRLECVDEFLMCDLFG
ncbi:hypothetical protein PINS_up000463 [Pythium insidiosum]|nr:hypothetical protein PINS_up000463 [Pythium insidiosum]